MVNWGNNVRFLRKHRRLSQDAMAQELHISRSKLNAHENGHTVNPPVEDLLAFSDYFGISIDDLLKTKLGELAVDELNKLIAGNEPYTKGNNLRVLAISIDRENKENIEYVPVKAKAGYRAGCHDPEFIAALPKYSFPGLPKGRTFRMFPTIGDSMLPIPEGSDILASYVGDWTTIKQATPCIVIFNSEQDFVFKNITQQSDGVLLLESNNGLYKPYTVHVSAVLEIWQFERFISQELPHQPTEMDELKTMLMDMKKQLMLK
ncbi:helix-turn-helix domain-containing protein [Mucilaginibacter sp.]|uniref:XRE family transcriptional regulator n=1 Tax=Mucilaginibacter sp. TaxID=1882438 RepID=UPI0026135C46|nr:helix-turn-helix domain-containing protein [Mucilaginibacter sp.]MDB5032680.1 DNA-binding protein [Mucilaginibacter sp.]